MLILPTIVAAEVKGIYFAPKFLLGIQNSGDVSSSRAHPSPDGSDPPVGDRAFRQYSEATFGGALAVGYNFAPQHSIPIRTEIEFALRSNTSNKRKFSTITPGSKSPGDPETWRGKQTTNLSTLFFNAYYDFNTGTPFTPYLGGGLGMAFNFTSIKGNSFYDGPDSTDKYPWRSGSKDTYDTSFAWNLGAGLAYAFTENIAVDLGYRFIGTGFNERKMTLRTSTDGTDAGSIKYGAAPYIHEFYLGARFTF